MIRLHLIESLIGPYHREVITEEWQGRTVRELMLAHRHTAWPDDVVVGAVLAGRKIEAEDLDHVLADGSELAVAPEVNAAAAGVWILEAIFVPLLAATAAGALYQMIVGKRQNQTVDRGDIESPTYAWDGIGTTSGAGFSIPAIGGQHKVGGQIIGSRVRALPDSTATDVLDVLVAWGYGRIEAIGDVTGGTSGEVNDLGALFGLGLPGKQLPGDLKINGNNARVPGVEVSLRMGEALQTPIPAFPDASTAQPVGGALETAGALVETSIGVAEVDYAVIRILFPGGLYRQSAATGQFFSYPVTFKIQWAVQGRTYSVPDYITIDRMSRARFFIEHRLDFRVTGPFFVRVERTTGNTGPGSDFIQSGAQFQTLTYFVQGKFAYPGIALMHMALLANERLQGQLDLQLSAIAKGLRLLLYDDTFGLSSTRHWTNPSSGSFSGIWTWPVGQNPAWFALEVLTAPWSGRAEYPIADIDLPAFRDFADHCDETIAYLTIGAITGGPFQAGETITGGGSGATGRVGATTYTGTTQLWFRPLSGSFVPTETVTGGTSGATASATAKFVDTQAPFSFDGVLDHRLSVWDQAQAVVAVGRGTLYKIGGKVSVAYEYRNMHGRGTNSVPERARSSLLNTANVESFSLQYLPVRDRPNVLYIQILNAALDYEHDMVIVEDPATYGLNAPYKLRNEDMRNEEIELYGVTNATRARREGLFIHALNRLTRTAVEITAGVDQLPVLPKDIIGVQFDAFRPFDQQSYGYRLSAAVTAGTTIKLDHAITVNSAIGQTRILIRETDGDIVEFQINMANGTYPADTNLTLAQVTGGPANVTAPKGAPCTVGFQAKLVRDYSVVSIKSLPNHKRQITAIEYHPEAFDVDTVASLADDITAASQGGPEAEPAPVEGPSLDGGLNGDHVLTWSPPEGKRPGRVRVFTSHATPEARERWWMSGEADTDGITMDGLQPHRRYAIHAAVEDRNGLYVSPMSDQVLTVLAPEFPSASPAQVQELAGIGTDDGILLTWAANSDANLDYYEIRHGLWWVGAQVIARTKQPRYFLSPNAYGDYFFQVRARHRNGCYSGAPNGVVTPYVNVFGDKPSDHVNLTTATDLSSGAAGTHSSTVWDGGLNKLRLDAEALIGTYTSAELDIGGGFDVFALWSGIWSQYWVDDTTTAAQLDFLTGSGEGRWWIGSSREPSSYLPGRDLDTMATDLPGPTGDYGNLFLGSGHIGHWARVTAEVRYYVGGAWSSWIAYQTQHKVAAKMQMRWRLERAHFGVEVYLWQARLAVSY